MKLNHINLTVTDVQAAEEFLVKYFGLQNLRSDGDNKNMGFLFDDGQLLLSLMKGPRGGQVHYPATFHIGFGQESEEKVNEINQRLRNDGYDVPLPARYHAWTFYIDAPGGFRIEVMA